ncbi:hypothetical protein AZE42_03978 [Rhizopogon vesiculosus]|uniref:Uncharacterized protein n=1 Tax=Rhizopogon vesiculosus TaxID=180088 RepID=A0A1J8QPE8_9AGAM|nr:hypothetical protein AZE42_03978 [Rhizopogon vesiculosus]
MQCAGPQARRAPLATIKQAIGDLHHVYDDNVKYMFSVETITELEYHRGDLTNVKFTTPLASRAWIAHYLSQLASMEDRLAQVPPVDTFRLTDDTLQFLAKSSKDFFQLDQKKPAEVTRRFPTSVDQRNGHIRATADRYANKLRKGLYQRASIAIGEGAGRGFTISGAVAKSQGRNAQLAPTAKLNLVGKIIDSIRIIGPRSEGSRDPSRSHQP